MRNKLTPAQRLETVYELTKTNGARLAKEMNWNSPSGLYHITNGVVKDISHNVAEEICKQHPKISYEYLIGLTENPLVSEKDMGYMMQKKLFEEMKEMKEMMQRILTILNKTE